MDRLLLGRYRLSDEIAVGLPVSAHDEVLSREVHVVLLPVGGGTTTQALRRLRAAATADRDDVPRILDLAVVDGCPVAVLMAGDGPPDLDTLVAMSCDEPATSGPAGMPPAVDRVRRPSMQGAIGQAAQPSRDPARSWVPSARPSLAIGLVALCAVVATLAVRQTAPEPGSASPPIASGPASKQPEATAPLNVARTDEATGTSTPSPDEQVVLLLAAVRDDPTAGPAAPGLLRLLRGLDASSGSERLALAGRVAAVARQAGQDGRFRQDLANRTLVVMGAVQNG